MSQETIQRAIQKAKKSRSCGDAGPWWTRGMHWVQQAISAPGWRENHCLSLPPSARPYLTMKPEDLAVGIWMEMWCRDPISPPLNFPCIWVFIRKDRR